MHDRYERFFAPRLLLGVNLAIILLAETLRGGRYFYDTGLIHIPVSLFVLLASTRIFGRYYLYDPVLKKFLGWSLAALSILLLSHGIEFADQNLGLQWPASAVYGGVISFHLTALLCIAVGAFHILKAYGRMRFASFWLVLSALVGVVSFLASLAAYVGLIPSVPPLLYMLIAFAAGVATCVPTLAISRLVPVLKEFSLYLTGALVFIVAAAGTDALHLVAKGEYVVYQQATYMSHFAFYAALSLMFLAFGKLSNLGGVYRDVAAAAEKGPRKRPRMKS
jgi:hypothetical protein